MPNKKLIAAINADYKQHVKDLKEYHTGLLKIECGFNPKTDEIVSFIEGLSFEGYEDVAWFCGYLSGLEQASYLAKNIE